jgi:hypothetical protein
MNAQGLIDTARALVADHKSLLGWMKVFLHATSDFAKVEISQTEEWQA